MATPSVIGVVLGVMGAAVVFFVMVRWWVDGVVNGSELFAYSAVYGGLVFGVFVSIGQGFPMWIALALLAGSVGWVIRRNQKEGLRSYYREQVKTYEITIRVDPTNTAARVGMAESYYSLGDLDRAIGTLEVASQRGRLEPKDNHRLAEWREEQKLRDSRTVVCHRCYRRNLWGSTTCWVCNSPIDYASRTWWDNMVDERTNIRFIIAVASWIVVLIGSIFLLEPAHMGIVVGCFTLTLIGWLMVSAKL